jgi:hypothetical protein
MQPALFACTSLALARAMMAANLKFAVSSGNKYEAIAAFSQPTTPE